MARKKQVKRSKRIAEAKYLQGEKNKFLSQCLIIICFAIIFAFGPSTLFQQGIVVGSEFLMLQIPAFLLLAAALLMVNRAMKYKNAKTKSKSFCSSHSISKAELKKAKA